MQMKRVGNLFESIISPENIALAAYKACRGKAMSSEVKMFRQDFLKNITEIRDEIIGGQITFGNYNRFVIYEPKERQICAAPLKQRIVHHAVMNICDEYFDRNLIYDSYASRNGKGVHKAINRVKGYIKSYRYFAKLDFRKYFDSIDHDVLKRLLLRMFKDSMLIELFNEIIDSYGDGRGLPIGNLTSQYFANYYLSGLDHFMKETISVPVYIRYMDDVIMMSNSMKTLKYYIGNYSNFAREKLKLDIKPPIVGRSCCGIPFLGYIIYDNSILMNGKGKRRLIRNVKILEELFSKSEISEKEYSARLTSMLAYVCFADSYKFRARLLS